MLGIQDERENIMNLDLIKEDMKKHVGERAEVSVYGLRNKTEYFIGTISKLYPYIFTVSVNNVEKSFNYADLITGEVVIKYL